MAASIASAVPANGTLPTLESVQDPALTQNTQTLANKHQPHKVEDQHSLGHARAASHRRVANQNMYQYKYRYSVCTGAIDTLKKQVNLARGS